MSLARIDVAAAAREIGPAVSDAAAVNEANGALINETVNLLVESGVAHFWVPRQFGGIEATPLEGLATIEALAYADAATGWVVMAYEPSTRTRPVAALLALIHPGTRANPRRDRRRSLQPARRGTLLA